MKLSIVVAIALFAAPGLAAPAAAQTRTRETPDYVEQNVGVDAVVTFVGDELGAPPGGAYGDTVRRPPGATRAGLIRPRLNFLVPLLKSVENL